MWYEGVADDGTRSIGVAVSDDGITDWVRSDRYETNKFYLRPSPHVPDIVGRRPAQELFGHGSSTHVSELCKLSPGQLVGELG